jgi:hypothetical protein
VWVLSVGFEDRRLAKWAGASWDPDKRRWYYLGAELPAKLHPFATQRHSWERWQEDDENRRRPEPSTGSIQLRPHQQQAADRIAAAVRTDRVGYVLADDVGLGKTFSAIAGVAATRRRCNILVLCPLSVVPHWRRSIDAYGGGNHRWCVINYDRAKALLDVPDAAAAAKRVRTRNKRIATKGRSRVDWDIVICDEAHRLKNPSAQRSAAVRNLIASRSTPAFVLWMSATAGQNPLELAYLAPFLAERTGVKVKDLADFEQWCRSQDIGVRRGPFGSWLWERNERDLTVMRALLFDDPSAGLRRRPQDLEGWPELVRALAPVALSSHQRSLYEEAWAEFCAALQLASTGDESTNPMVAALRFRQKSSLLRVDQTVEFANDLLANGLQVAVSVQFLDTATAIAEALDAPVISGAQGPKEREANRIAFQRGEARSVVFTVTEGISLHAGEQSVAASDAERALLIHDLRWSALDMAQIEGRCVLQGQRVHTDRGAVPIEHIVVGDNVLTRTGAFSPVTAVWLRGAAAENATADNPSWKLVVAISAGQSTPLQVTGDHQIWVRRDGTATWVVAEEVRPGDFVATPAAAARAELTEHPDVPAALFSAEPAGLDDSRLLWRQVTAVDHREASSSEQFWDLEVDGDPSFVAEGVVVHNCHRDGQNAVAYYLYGEETVEERVAAAVLAKLSDMASMLGDDQVALDALLSAGGWDLDR